MSQGVLLQSSTPSSFTLAPSGSELMRTFTMAAIDDEGAGGGAATEAVTDATAGICAGTAGGGGRKATKAIAPATARAPPTATTSIPFDPGAGGAVETNGVADAGPSLRASGAGKPATSLVDAEGVNDGGCGIGPEV